VRAAPLEVGERTSVDAAALPFEYLLNALRLNEGFCDVDFESRTGVPIARIAAPLQAAADRGLLERRGAGWRPSDLGRRFLNDLQASFLP
jgi:coproporphyrinogen III oxidase-like Fe-S oxidoreductase